MTKPTSLSRRRFMSYLSSTSFSGLVASPALALFTTTLGGISQRAWAQSLGFNPRNLLFVMAGGAPNRICCDSFLTPYGSQGFVSNPGVATGFQLIGGRYAAPEYRTIQIGGLNVPPMWGWDLPAAPSGYRPMASLLNNMFVMAGLDTRNAGHGFCQNATFYYPGAKRSTSAMSGDASDAPIAAVNAGAAGFSHKSTVNRSSVSIGGGGNMVSRLLDAFRPTGSTPFQSQKSSIREAYDAVLPHLDKLARAGHPGAESLVLNRRAALELAATDFATLDAQWNTLVAKYESLIRLAIFDPSRQLPGLTDNPIGQSSGRDPLHYRVNRDSLLELDTATDLRSAVDSRTTIGGLAANFAFAEYVLLNQVSSSVSISAGGLGPLIRERDGTARESLPHDQHFTGVYTATFLGILWYRALYSCVAEIIERLKERQLFNDTVIVVAGEFNRNPRMDMAGSDHGFNGTSRAMFCGAFNGPLVVGNLSADNRGSWGRGGPISQLGRLLQFPDYTVQLAHLLRVPPTLTSATPPVILGPNGLSSTIGLSTLV